MALCARRGGFPVLIGAVVLLGFVNGDDVRAQASPDWQHAAATGLTSERMVGLLDLPDLLLRGCRSLAPASIDLYADPSVWFYARGC